MTIFDRGRYGFRYACGMPDCDASVVVWSTEPRKQLGSYSPPDPWRKEYGGTWCETHWPAIEQHRDATKAWVVLQQAHNRPLYEEVARQCAEWEEAHPRPVAPWLVIDKS